MLENHPFQIEHVLVVDGLPGALGNPPTVAAFVLGPIPPDLLLAGIERFAQALWIDAAPGSPEPLRLTNALAIQLGH